MHMDVITALAVQSVGASTEKTAGFKMPGKMNLNPLPYLKGLFGGGTKAVKSAPMAMDDLAASVAPKASTAAARAATPRAPSTPTPTAPTPAASTGAASARASTAPPPRAPTPTPAASAGAASAGASTIAQAPRSMASRLGRTAAGVGAVGTAAVGAGHYNNSRNEAAMNPFESYRKHNDAVDQMTGPIDKQLAETGSDMGRYKQLMAQRESGDFGASPWSFGGLNPFVESGAASRRKTMQDRVTEASNQFTNATNDFGNTQKSVDLEIEAIKKRLTRPGMRPQDRKFYQSQLENLNTTRKGLGTSSAEAERIKTQAREAGMFEDGDAFPTPGGPAQLGAASVPPASPVVPPAPVAKVAPPTSPVVNTAPPTPPPNSNPLLTGGAQRAPLTPTNYRMAPLF